MSKPLDFIHEFRSSTSSRTLLLLDGTGGTETDLLPVGGAVDSRAALLSPRGTVRENGMPRFFRRLTGLCGYYTMVAMTLNAFGIGAEVSTKGSPHGAPDT